MKKQSFGTWLTIYSEAVAEILATAGYDWITVDLEHSPISLSQAEKLVRVIDLAGAKPYVRVSSNNAAEIKKVLDFGAKGIIVPMVNSAQEVSTVLDAVFYPPVGNRGMGLYRAQGYGEAKSKQTYISQIASEIEVFVQIESKLAVEKIEEIFDNPITGYFLGPYDLSASIGKPAEFNAEEFLQLEQKVLETAKKFDIQRGIHIVEPDPKLIADKVRIGYDTIAYSVDFRMLDVMARQPFKDA